MVTFSSYDVFHAHSRSNTGTSLHAPPGSISRAVGNMNPEWTRPTWKLIDVTEWRVERGSSCLRLHEFFVSGGIVWVTGSRWTSTCPSVRLSHHHPIVLSPSLQRRLDVQTGYITQVERYALLVHINSCLLYTSPSPRDRQKSRMPSSA